MWQPQRAGAQCKPCWGLVPGGSLASLDQLVTSWLDLFLQMLCNDPFQQRKRICLCIPACEGAQAWVEGCTGSGTLCKRDGFSVLASGEQSEGTEVSR